MIGHELHTAPSPAVQRCLLIIQTTVTHNRTGSACKKWLISTTGTEKPSVSLHACMWLFLTFVAPMNNHVIKNEVTSLVRRCACGIAFLCEVTRKWNGTGLVWLPYRNFRWYGGSRVEEKLIKLGCGGCMGWEGWYSGICLEQCIFCASIAGTQTCAEIFQ